MIIAVPGADQPRVIERLPPPSPDKRSHELLESTKQTLIENGSRNFTMRVVARTADISLGNLQHHFRSLETLVEQLINHVIAEYQRRLDTSPFANLTPARRLEALAEDGLSDTGSARTQLLFLELRSLALSVAGGDKWIEMLYRWNINQLAGLLVEMDPELTEATIASRGRQIAAMLDGADPYIQAARAGGGVRGGYCSDCSSIGTEPRPHRIGKVDLKQPMGFWCGYLSGRTASDSALSNGRVV